MRLAVIQEFQNTYLIEKGDKRTLFHYDVPVVHAVNDACVWVRHSQKTISDNQNEDCFRAIKWFLKTYPRMWDHNDGRIIYGPDGGRNVIDSLNISF
jgi:hypothetical protein